MLEGGVSLWCVFGVCMVAFVVRGMLYAFSSVSVCVYVVVFRYNMKAPNILGVRAFATDLRG